ncbi:phosphopantetheine-binding protein [Geothrix fuzhouensis]|uniref:phosphopantetheine-binding protein n=1 Tax=Geothrix fuzhouensis TaxID=2966451 RepID=UPI0021492434|nr:phosphopantetheine-binding protein [Geothrix fuzhouensis]
MQDITTTEIKHFIIRTLDLEDIQPEEIEDEQPLFKDGLGLDSIDAFELGLALKKAYRLNLDSEDVSSFAHHFRTPASLAAFVSSHRQVTI